MECVTHPSISFAELGCLDGVTSSIQTQINNYGYTNCHINSYCSFTPNGTFYEISGNTNQLINDYNGSKI